MTGGKGRDEEEGRGLEKVVRREWMDEKEWKEEEEEDVDTDEEEGGMEDGVGRRRWGKVLYD
jgi:hypothetical protein